VKELKTDEGLLLSAILLRLIVILAFLFLATGEGRAKDIIIAADQWCPYNCVPDSDKEGFQVEIVKEALKPYGLNVIYRNMPYNRAIKLAEEGRIDGVFGFLKTESPTLVYPTQNVGYSVNVAVTQADNKWWYTALDKLDGKKILTIDGYSYGPTLDAYLKSGKVGSIQPMHGEDALQQALKVIAAGRADVFFEDKNVAYNAILKMGLVGKVKIAGNITKPQPTYIAFSPLTDTQYDLAAKFDASLQELKKNGRLAAIYKKYNLSDLSIRGDTSKIITIAADQEWRPYYGPDLPEQGVLMAIIHAAIKASGHEPQSHYINWTRAMNATARGDYDLIAGIYHTPDRAKQFSYSQPILNVHSAFVSRKGTVTDTSWKGLSDKWIATVAENAISEEFASHRPELNIRELRTTQMQVKMLANGRVDLAAASNIRVFLHVAKENGYPVQMFEIHKPSLATHPVYTASSKLSSAPLEILEIFNRGLEKIIQDGEYDAILNRLSP